ncbi:hypothetical protein [Mobiluncus mulieris]|uniref:hypothetical protein n=1 Tax=Mobiluncus mulieris TaxID=2052 RepID=UPI00146FCC92|nr:hypothetical protein [Mobiluncus mulieris]NMX11128.1 hypothetical protein [Mobiluncus mulieris]
MRNQLQEINNLLATAIPPVSQAALIGGSIKWEEEQKIGINLNDLQFALQYLTALHAQLNQYLQGENHNETI